MLISKNCLVCGKCTNVCEECGGRNGKGLNRSFYPLFTYSAKSTVRSLSLIIGENGGSAKAFASIRGK
jgi:hypothetical protein